MKAKKSEYAIGRAARTDHAQTLVEYVTAYSVVDIYHGWAAEIYYEEAMQECLCDDYRYDVFDSHSEWGEFARGEDESQIT